MTKILQFKNFDKRIQYIKDLMNMNPESKETKDLIDKIFKESKVDKAFFAERLKYSNNDNIDLLLYLITLSDQKLPDEYIEELTNNSCLTKYVREKIAAYCDIKIIKKDDESNIFVPNDADKKQSLNSMLQIAQFGQNFATELIKELLDTPYEQQIEMIHYIGNFDDSRTFLLLMEFYNQANIEIKTLCLEYLEYKQNEDVLTFYKNLYKASQIYDESQENELVDEIIKGYNMLYYSLVSVR